LLSGWGLRRNVMKDMLGSLLLAATLLGTTGACVVEARGRVVAPQPTVVVEVEEEPPPPRRVVVESRPGFIFIEGHWYRRGGRWEWRDGYWERERSGYVWMPGRWERRGRRHVWIEGSWRAGGGPAIRDHRDHRDRREPPPAAPPPAVRDQRD
jgi:hypothetical protein